MRISKEKNNPSLRRPQPDLRFGDWQEALADIETCDAIITDPPYGAATQEGHNNGVSGDGAMRHSIDYEPLTRDQIVEFCTHWRDRCQGWIVVMTSHDLTPIWMGELSLRGRYVFAPLPVVELGSRVRLAGDGPSGWTVWMVVSRPRKRPYATWGTLPGAYVSKANRDEGRIIGGKSLNIMRAIVRDYTRPGDVVVDPYAGHGTTLRACAIENRYSIGTERDLDTYEAADAYLTSPYSQDMFANNQSYSENSYEAQDNQ